MKKTFYFIRHGQTDLNLKGIVQGRGVNSPLNENGIRQSQLFYQAYQHIPFDKIYISTLLRTYQTVEPFIRDGIAFEKLSGLDEISWGIYEGKEQDDATLVGFENMVNGWKNGNLDLAIENGESPNQLVVRQKEAIAHMLQQEDEQTILVCMHGRALRVILCHLTGTDLSKMDEFPHSNTSLYVVDYENGNFSIVDFFNTKHLASIADEQN